MFGARAIGLYEGMLPYNIMLVIGMLLFLFENRHDKAYICGNICLMGTLLFISLIVYYNTGEKGLLLYFTMMLGMKNVSLKRVMKWAAAILSISFTVLVFLSVFGWKQDITYLNDRCRFRSGAPALIGVSVSDILLLYDLYYIDGSDHVCAGKADEERTVYEFCIDVSWNCVHLYLFLFQYGIDCRNLLSSG